MLPTKPTIRVYLVDDHEVVRRGVASLLQSDPAIEIVGQAGTATDALREILALRPDVVLLDNHLPDGSGIDVCREMRAVDPSIKGLVLSTYDDPAAISSAIMAGASGYVLKQIEGTSLVSGVHLVAGGHSLIDPGVARHVVEQMQTQQKSFDALADLTPQQRKIFALIAEGMTNRQIAEKLYLAEKTVKNHVTGLLSRLGLEHRTQAALLAARLQGPAGPSAASSMPRTRRYAA